MNTGFSQRHPDFAAIENHIRRAHAERAVVIATWIAEALVGAVAAARGMLSRSAARSLPDARLVVKASLPR